jgi:hypothetical protein
MPPIEAVAGDSVGQTGGQTGGQAGGQGEGDFTLSDDVMNSDFGEEIEIPSEEAEVPSTEGGAAGQTVPRPAPAAPTGTPVQPGGQQGAAAAPKPGDQPAGQQPPPQQPAEGRQVPQGQTDGGQATGRVYTPAELAQALGGNREKMIDALASQKFQLTPAEIQALEVDAVGVLPKLMARVYFDATVNGLQQLANMVPRMVEHIANERITENSAEDAFHREWPNIDRNNQQHMRTVAQLAASYRQMNPRATQAEAIKFVGMAATNFLGLQMPQRNSQGSGSRPGNAQRRTAPPFAPATGGRAQPLPGTPTGAQGPFEGLGLNFDE